MTDREIYRKALEAKGYHHQKMVLVEECGELLNAIAKSERGRAKVADIITELADVSIMVEQMALFFGWKEFEEEKKRKLERLNQRLQ